MKSELIEKAWRTSAKRKLITEADILTIKYRVELGVPLNSAVKTLQPHMSNVSTIKLVRWHTEMEETLAKEDYTLYEAMRLSLFPVWLPAEQPDTACYIGQFPYGYWEETE